LKSRSVRRDPVKRERSGSQSLSFTCVLSEKEKPPLLAFPIFSWFVVWLRVEAFGGAIQSQQSEHGVQQMHDGRQDDQNMHSSGPTIQRPRVGKQYESFNDKGGLNEPDYEAVARGIERVKRDRQERFARYYRAAQEEYERRRAEARNRIEANQRAIEQVRDRKSGIKELAQKLFERVRITVQKKVEQYQERLQNNRGIGL